MHVKDECRICCLSATRDLGVPNCFTYLDIDARPAQLTVVNRCVKCTTPYHIDCDGVLAPGIFIEAVDYIATFCLKHIESAFILMYLKDRSFALEGTDSNSSFRFCMYIILHFYDIFM